MSIPKVQKPVTDEILTTYIARTAQANYYKVREFFAMLGVNPRGQFNHRIDIRPRDFIDLSFASGLTGQSQDTLLALTFYPLERKFIRSSIRPTFEMLRGLYAINRRYCPLCLMEFEKRGMQGVYKSIWQITDVSICDKHKTPLITQCKFCGAVQPYIDDSLVAYHCKNCGKDLGYETEQCAQASSEQLKRVSQWQALISNGIEGLADRPEIVYEVLITITLIFLLQKSKDAAINDIPQGIISRPELSRAFSLIKSGRDYFLTPFMLLKYLNCINVSVEEFFNTKVPDWFIDKLLDYLKIDYGQLCYSERNTKSQPNRRAIIRPDISPKKGRAVKATVADITYAANQLRKNNRPITYKNIAELAGISVRCINKRPDLIEAIKEIKSSSANLIKPSKELG